MSPTSFKMPTKYETLLLNHVFKTNLSTKKKNLKENYDIRQKKKKNTHCMQSINDEANNIIIRSRIVNAN